MAKIKTTIGADSIEKSGIKITGQSNVEVVESSLVGEPQEPTLDNLSKSKTDLYHFDPADIDIRPEDNGRVEQDDDLESLKQSIKSQGQLEPVGIRWDAGSKRPRLVFGFRRFAAISEISAGLKAKGRKPMTIACMVVGKTQEDDAEAFLKNIAENLERKATTPIDDAQNIQRLSTPVSEGGFGLTLKEIAKLYNKSQPWCSQRIALLRLPENIQAKIKDGSINAYSADALLYAPEEVVEQVTADLEAGKPVTRTDIIELARENKAKAKAEGREEGKVAAAPKKGKAGRKPKVAGEHTKARTRSDVLKLIEALSEFGKNDVLGVLGIRMGKWLAGKGTNSSLVGSVRKLFDSYRAGDFDEADIAADEAEAQVESAGTDGGGEEGDES